MTLFQTRPDCYSICIALLRRHTFCVPSFRADSPEQIIGYLPNLKMSPTNDSVVMKTLEMANQIADECNQKYVVATYDLAIAMKAYHIIDCMSPRFDRIFVNLGGFHIEMSYFKVCIINLCLRGRISNFHYFSYAMKLIFV